MTQAMDMRGYFARETAVVDQPCEIGTGTKIWHFSHVMRDSRIGARCNIGQNVVVSPHCTIGDNVKIQNNVSVYTGVIIEDDVFCGPSMVFTNVVNPRSFIERKDEFRQTLVRRGASIGAHPELDLLLRRRPRPRRRRRSEKRSQMYRLRTPLPP